MYQYFDTLTDDSGNALLGATVTVTNYPSGTLATIYQTNGTVSPVANSVVSADITGQVSFFAPDGAYTLTYAYKGTNYKVRQPVQLLDPLGFVAQPDAGAVNAVVVAGSQLPGQLYAGLKAEVSIAVTNTGPATLSYNGNVANIKQPGGSALLSGMLQANGLSRFEFDGTQWQLVGVLSQPFYPIVAAETTAGAVIINSAYPAGTVDRYANNTVPGTTDMGPAVNTAITVALAAVGMGQSGIPIRFLNGAYSIATAIVFPLVSTNILPLDIGGVGIGSQIINNLGALTGPTFNFTAKNGWYLHDLLICGNSVHRNDGIWVNVAGGGESIEWRIERVTSLAAGVGLKMADTNTGNVLAFRHWPGNNPGLIIPQTVNNADHSHGIYLTGSFCHNISIYDCVCPPNSNYSATMRGIKCDAGTSEGCTIVMPLVQTGSGLNNETGIDWNPSGSTDGMAIIGCYHEGTIISIGNTINSSFSGFTDGATAGSLILNAGTRQCVFSGVNVATLTIAGTTNFGNTFIGVNARSAFTDGNEAINNSTQPNRFIGCNIWNGTSAVTIPDLGGYWRKLVAWAANIQLDTYVNSINVIRVLPAQVGTAFTITAPTHKRNGQFVWITVRNETGGALGVITWSAIFQAGWVNPANGFNRSMCLYYDSDFDHWQMLFVTTVDVPN